ncbi:MAG: GNAT family N-acetyltransferase [Merismopedia sp. SIO2A8]|nr:GNAT family N-acetyltransferase [Merismopedia sp. SIO2A8]
MAIYLRLGNPSDLAFIVATEQAEQQSGCIGHWSLEQHQAAVTNPDIAHYVIERNADRQCVGYLILRGIQNVHQNIELQRIVVTEKGKGYGRTALQQVKELAFKTYNAHRLWLDVKSHNPRAKALYTSEGFIVEGTLRECLQLSRTPQPHQPLTQARISLVIMSILRSEYELASLP